MMIGSARIHARLQWPALKSQSIKRCGASGPAQYRRQSFKDMAVELIFDNVRAIHAHPHNFGNGQRRLQHFLGHASITNTVRYTAMSPEPFKDIWR